MGDEVVVGIVEGVMVEERERRSHTFWIDVHRCVLAREWMQVDPRIGNPERSGSVPIHRDCEICADGKCRRGGEDDDDGEDEGGNNRMNGHRANGRAPGLW